MADNPQIFDIPIGNVKGPPGNTGNGISSIALLQTVGLDKTYRITMTDETHYDFTVTDGNGISGVAFNPETYTLTLTFDDGTSYTTGSLRGAPGAPGNDGISPAVTITTITGGHRVTITDRDHPQGQTFDVMDGAGNVTSVAGKTGAVTLDGNDVSFDQEDDYDDGTVGKALKDELNAISQKAPVIINSASGDIASFPDGADSMPIKSLVASIEPVQDLHGYENPWPGGGNVNKFDEETVVGRWENADGTFDASATEWTSSENPIPVVAGQSNYINMVAYRIYYDANMGYVGYDGNGANVATTPANAAYMHISQRTNEWASNVIVAISSTAVPYSPYSNECPISGWTGANISQSPYTQTEKHTITGKNLYNAPNNALTVLVPCHIENGVSVVVSAKNGGNSGVRYYNASKTRIDYCTLSQHDTRTGRYYRQFTATGGIEYVEVYGGDATDIMVETGVTVPSDYEPYGRGIPITWQSEAGTVYGGTLDVVSGKLIANMAKKKVSDINLTLTNDSTTDPASKVFRSSEYTSDADAIGGEGGYCDTFKMMEFPTSWSGLSLVNGECACHNSRFMFASSEYSTIADFKTAYGNVEVIYRLRQPVEYTLTANELTTLYGQNNVWTDVGEVSIHYPADTKLYIDNKIATAVANALNA